MDIFSSQTGYAVAAAIAALVAAIALQQRVIARLREEAETVTLRFQELVGQPRTVQVDLLAAYPQPLCIADPTGGIFFMNAAFQKLAGMPKTLADLDRQWNSALSELLEPARSVTTGQLSLRKQEGDGWRRFAAVAWPVNDRFRLPGKVIALHEQTKVHERSLSRSEFERQLVLSLTEVIRLLTEPGKQHKRFAEDLRQAVTELTEHHSRVRTPRTPGSSDLAAAFQESLVQVRPSARSRGVRIVASAPKSLSAQVPADDAALACRLLMGAAVELAPDHGSVEATLGTDEAGRPFVACQHQAGSSMHHGRFEHAIANGEHSVAAHVRLALCRELAHKFDGTLTIQTNPEQETLYRLTFCGSGKTAR